MRGIRVLQAGLLTTVQDAGRHGYQSVGIAVGGVMDDFAFRVVNWLVGNFEEQAVLEVTVLGPKLLFEVDAIIAIGGAELNAQLDDEPLTNWCAHFVKAGSTLSFGNAQCGCRAYLAVAGGVKVAPAMGSRSTDMRAKIGGLNGRALQKDDVIPVENSSQSDYKSLYLAADKAPNYPNGVEIGVIVGPQSEHFTERGITDFYSSLYQVTGDANRMGYRLAGAEIEHAAASDIISDAICFGSIQVPGSGQPIIMMADRQTTGGYAQIATVVTADLHRLAQLKAGDSISFKRVEIADAQQQLRQYREYLDDIRAQLYAQWRGVKCALRRYRVTVNRRAYDVILEEL